MGEIYEPLHMSSGGCVVCGAEARWASESAAVCSMRCALATGPKPPPSLPEDAPQMSVESSSAPSRKRVYYEETVPSTVTRVVFDYFGPSLEATEAWDDASLKYIFERPRNKVMDVLKRREGQGEVVSVLVGRAPFTYSDQNSQLEDRVGAYKYEDVYDALKSSGWDPTRVSSRNERDTSENAVEKLFKEVLPRMWHERSRGPRVRETVSIQVEVTRLDPIRAEAERQKRRTDNEREARKWRGASRFA